MGDFKYYILNGILVQWFLVPISSELRVTREFVRNVSWSNL